MSLKPWRWRGIAKGRLNDRPQKESKNWEWR
uniref:Uncharacterized protein n=1 Tax=Physcomitrium patens TaxID=3218 RepID=A0A2K1L176_PHYPA|nr:hypothetical protein PHYPA_002564 [Physcomitrium patens]